MPKQLSGGGASDERGTMLVIMAVICLTLTLLFVAIAEFGKWLIVREQTQTAVDAAALASSTSGIHRWVKIDVVTDRGQREHCNKEECWCSPCSTKRIRNIPGDERRLLDEGGWEEYCLPECDCGGGDCWFEVKDRWVTYDITSFNKFWGISPEEINRVGNEIVNAARESLIYKTYPHENTVRKILQGRNIQEMKYVLSSTSRWWRAWKDVDYWCRKRCNLCNIRDEYESCRSCGYCYSNAREAFYKLNSGSRSLPAPDWLDQIAFQLKKIRQVNQRGSLEDEDLIADDVASQFFYANLPEHANKSDITRVNVHNRRNDRFYPAVTVYARSIIKSNFPNFLGVFPDKYTMDVCGQGDTFYRDPATQGGRHYDSLIGVGKWSKAPPDACWED